MATLQVAIFALASAGLVYVSRASLRRPRCHGFYRFWAWEAILALALLNAPAWFRTPWAWHQLISWSLLSASIVPLVCGVGELRRSRRAGPEDRDASLLGFERTAELVTRGVFRCIRHPMYSSLLLLAWGVFFKAPSWPGLALGWFTTGFLVAAARVEEKENTRFFGPAYAAYIARTRMFIPYLF